MRGAAREVVVFHLLREIVVKLPSAEDIAGLARHVMTFTGIWSDNGKAW